MKNILNYRSCILTAGQSLPIQFNDRTALKHLKELHIAVSKLKHPTLPYHTAPKFSATKTNGLTNCVLHFLRLKGHQAERNNTTGRYIDKSETVIDVMGYRRKIGSSCWIPGSGTKGSADISATIAGRSIKIEIKCAETHDCQRPTQRKYKVDAEASGGVYLIVTSFAMFVNWYYQNMERAKI